MEIKVIRKPNKIATPGQFTIDGANICRSLEPKTPRSDADRIAGQCCVPLGKYLVKPRFEGSVYGWMKSLVPDVEKWGVPHIMNMPGVEYPYWCENDEKSPPNGIDASRFVLIHIGNSLADTKACCLVGMAEDGDARIQRSVEAFKKIFKEIKEPMKNGTLTIEYVEE